VLLPRFVQAGRKPDEDFFLAFSPERVDPGNRQYFTHNTPKVLGGLTPKSFEIARAMYACFIETLVPVSSTDSAEMVKLLENTFRAVNIGLVNEVAIMCARLGLDTWEVIQAAASKPFGFMPFYPGPGLGGHCIPIDPLYLSWKLKTLKYHARFITLADEINSAMPEFIGVMVADALNARKKAVRGSRILICGVTYKRNIDDVRESPALDIMELLQRRGAEVSYSDPHAPVLHLGGQEMRSISIDEAGRFDCVVITTDHGDVDYAALCERAQLVVDTRNATRAVRAKHPTKIVAL
jgi:UDP-N-acetyl-D-glucosamine dehydrogenase